jgi:hypothetical protein
MRFPCNCSRRIERNAIGHILHSHAFAPLLFPPPSPPPTPVQWNEYSHSPIYRYNPVVVYSRWVPIKEETKTHRDILLIYLWVLFNNMESCMILYYARCSCLGEPLLVCVSDLFIIRICAWYRSILEYTAFREHFCSFRSLSPADGVWWLQNAVHILIRASFVAQWSRL